MSATAVGKSRTACRNAIAPSRAASRGPPSRATRSRTYAVAARRTAASDPWAANSARTRPERRAASSRNAANRTRRPLGGDDGGAGIARRRRSSRRSSWRSPTPRHHRRSSAREVRTSRAAALTERRSASTASAPYTNSTECVLLGNASQGSTRSRCLHERQRAIQTAIRTSPSSVRSQRSTRLLVKRSLEPPQAAHLQSVSAASRRLATYSS